MVRPLAEFADRVEPCELVPALYEHGGLGWEQLALVREVQVSFAHSSTQRLSLLV